MKDYCRADVELLSKAILKYRTIFKDKFDVDPLTLASLCMAIFRGCFLPEKSTVSSAPNKHVSNVSKEWLVHKKIETTEHPIIVIYGCYKYKPKDIHKDKIYQHGGESKVYYNSEKHVFTVDGFNKKENKIYEFNGCYFHGCPKCHPDLTEKYNKTIERNSWLEIAGYNVEMVWGCDWEKLKNTFPDKQKLEEKARQRNIITREALMGGRTEAFKTYAKCKTIIKKFTTMM